MKRKIAIAVVALVGAFLWGWGLGLIAPAGASTVCGGNTTHTAAPIDCTRTKVLLGSTWTAHLVIGADGHGTITVTLAAPRPTDSPVLATWHDGISSGPTAYKVGGTIPAGGTSIVLHVAKENFDSKADCGGQIDVKVIQTLGSQSAGRLTAPYITVKRCAVIPPTTTTVPSSSSVPPTTPPHGGSSTVPATTPGVGLTTTPGTIAIGTARALPATGGNDGPAIIGALVVTLGVVCLLAAADKRRSA